MVINYKLMMLKDEQHVTFWLIVSFLVVSVNSLTSGGTNYMQIYAYNAPTYICSSYCMYEIKADYNLNSLCLNTYSVGNGYCTKCDPLLFRDVLGATATTLSCIPHLYNSQKVVAEQISLNYQYGFFSNNLGTGWSNYQPSYQVAAIPPHYAIRLRFGVYLYYWTFWSFIYPLEYSIDDVSRVYNQTLDKYWSPYDIITSPLQDHSDNVAWISFRLLDSGYPVNIDAYCNNGLTDGTCLCRVGGYADCSCHFGVCPTSGCCTLRYIQITDMLVFASLCQTGCLNCTSSTYCKICDFSSGYYLNPVDHTCYTTCPQATYKDDITTFLNSYPAVIEHWCTACPATCLECSMVLAVIVCTKCYAYGRNQSFLFFGSCLTNCINGYQGNYSTHVCDCKLDYFYEVPLLQTCYTCAAECVRCTGPTNLQCTYCEKNYYLAYQTTHCLVECPVGQYKNDFTRNCFLCDPSCSSCKTQSTLCTECFFTNPIKYLLGQQCLTWCPPGYSWNNVTFKCDICDYYTYSLSGKCVNLCPSMYFADNFNRSCIHLSKTGFKFNLTLISVSLLSHGKLIRFEILAQDGLNTTSYEAIMTRSYYNAQIIYKDSMVQSYNGVVRSLISTNLPIKNIKYENNRIYFYTQLPANLDYRKSFQILFLESLAGNQNIYYNNLTNAYPVESHPQLIKQYYSFTVENIYYVIMIPFIAIIFFLFTIQLKGVYELYMELLRMVQLLGLLVYSSFPVGQYIFFFLVGCSYSNLDFIPNLYAMAAKTQSVRTFTSYFFIADDMDFIRLNGSVLLFGVVWAVVVLISKYLIEMRESRLNYMVRFGVDLVEVKILHSFWSALLFVVINYNATNFSVFVTFLFAFILFLAVLGRRYAAWVSEKDISPLFIWRLFSTLLICFISLANQLLISLIACLSLTMTLWEFYTLHSNKYLISINNLNSENYMSEKTYKILNKYDEQISYCWSISIRNTVITILPVMTSLLASVLILLKENEVESVLFTTTLVYFFLLVVIIDSIFIYNFLDERRKYLVQNKLQYLQKKYAKLGNQSVVYEERKRPRVANSSALDDEKYLEQHPARSMMKNID